MKIFKDEKHDHYFISDGVLYESYNTLRGLRFRELLHVAGMPDNDMCSEDDIKIIEESFKP